MVVVRGLLGAVAAKIFFGGTAPKLMRHFRTWKRDDSNLVTAILQYHQYQ